MSHFTNILKYAKPYKAYAIGHLISNVFYALFGALSFVALIPMLDILFQNDAVAPTVKPVYQGIGSLKDFYKDSVAPALKEKFAYKNSMEIPKIEKIVINMGLGRLTDAGKDNKVMDEAVDELARITGQKPVV